MKVFITGATGFVGSYLIKELLEQGHQILCLTRNLRSVSLPAHNNIRFIEGDIIEPNTYKNFLYDIDIIYHLAGYVKHESFKKDVAYKNNIIGSRNIFNLAIENNIKKVIYLNSAGIFHSASHIVANEESQLPDKFINYYIYSKYLSYVESQEFIKKGLNIITIMPVSIYGNGSPLFIDFLNFLTTKKVFFKKLLDRKLSLVYVGDVVDAILKAEKSASFGKSYLLTGHTISINDIIKNVEDVFRIKIRIFNVPIFLMNLSIHFLDIISVLINRSFFINKQIFNFLSGNIFVSSAKIKSELSWKTSNFEETFLDMLLWYKNNLK